MVRGQQLLSVAASPITAVSVTSLIKGLLAALAALLTYRHLLRRPTAAGKDCTPLTQMIDWLRDAAEIFEEVAASCVEKTSQLCVHASVASLSVREIAW